MSVRVTFVVASVVLMTSCSSPGCPEGYTRRDDRCIAESEACDGADLDGDELADVDDPDADAWCNDPSRALPSALARCGASGCEVDECDATRLDCTSAPGCETDPVASEEHCGTCGHACGWECRASECDDAVQIESGWAFHCARRASGTVVCWGSNDQGRLGDGTRTDRATPVIVVGIDDAVEITLGEHHACARRSDGSVWCWGSNASQQLARPVSSLGFSNTPIEALPSSAGAVEIAGGGFHSCARLATGRVTCWGDNARGQLGDGTRTSRPTPADANIDDVVELSAGSFHMCARRRSGGVSCWGADPTRVLADDTRRDVLSPPPAIARLEALSITAGNIHNCAIRSDRRAVCWGDGRFGALGVGTVANHPAPDVVVAELTDVDEIAAGHQHTCARVGSDVFCWGNNGLGELGTGTLDYETLPRELPVMTDAIDLSVRGHDTCVLRRSGEVVCWGHNDAGQIGDGTTGEDRLAPGAPVSPPE
ncbi:RCC1 domain-containing protein [Sandaracinus amylolyticus]|uniref:RCC1 domain-containing protein n=1 Tax=Sandaracinus amylolyticus TaxID=927083 RepID=UPI001F306139|nr:RCC1 domain-containing protein [Sandaracinus amylolyticus]UJR81404.1 BNR repeat domain protein [Sandaracinus amylolyticus]